MLDNMQLISFGQLNFDVDDKENHSSIKTIMIVSIPRLPIIIKDFLKKVI